MHPCQRLTAYPECRTPRIKFVYSQLRSVCEPIAYTGCEPSAKYRYFDTKEHCERDCLDVDRDNQVL